MAQSRSERNPRTAAANDAGYGNGGTNGVGDDNGYNGSGNGQGNGDDNGGWDNGDDNGGWDNGGGRGHRHHDGRGNGNGGGGATAVKGGCSDWTTGYNAGLLNGNQFDTTLQVPINISGNAVSVLGFSQAQSSGGALAYSC
ncbi:chaplin family protein [Dactylosporangium sp. McL0621]|uniref:chaplin family protein n=1 Tax=Dactylosporangium sp. McL0621 TaxID=3415678 RepID=UPI003CF539BA